jgi:Putative amidoligase enzyme
MFTRSFGVELEVLRPYSTTAYYDTVRMIKAAGIPCELVPYGSAHQVHSTWKVTYDGTVVGAGLTGMEVVSPPLHGPEGLEEACKVADLLKASGHSVNTSCGMHVHVHVAPLPQSAKNRLAVDYARHEKIIDSLLPPSRRGARAAGGYACTVANVKIEDIMAVTTATQLATVMARGGQLRQGRRRRYHSTKYVKLNFTPHYTYGTVEFRHHSGTVESQKVRQWVRFCLRMVHKAKESAERNDPIETETATRTVAVRARTVRPGTKLAIVAGLLLREEGTTRAEAMAATGWPSISMQDNARQLGLVLRSTRGFGGTLRYYGARPEAGAVQTVTARTVARPSLDGLLDSLGMPEGDKAYWHTRQALFARHSTGDSEEPLPAFTPIAATTATP